MFLIQIFFHIVDCFLYQWTFLIMRNHIYQFPVYSIPTHQFIFPGIIFIPVLQIKTNPFASMHSFCRNTFINFDCFFQSKIIMVFSHDWKLHALCYIETDRSFWSFLFWLSGKDRKSFCIFQTGK